MSGRAKEFQRVGDFNYLRPSDLGRPGDGTGTLSVVAAGAGGRYCTSQVSCQAAMRCGALRCAAVRWLPHSYRYKALPATNVPGR